jgi:hypothetical protein
MKRSRFSEEQIIGILQEHGVSVTDLCRKHGVSAALSSMTSASIRFSRVFSSSSVFSRLASETSIPPNFAVHLYC